MGFGGFAYGWACWGIVLLMDRFFVEDLLMDGFEDFLAYGWVSGDLLMDGFGGFAYGWACWGIVLLMDRFLVRMCLWMDLFNF